MKIGIVNFDTASAGVNQFFDKVITELENNNSVSKINVPEDGTGLQIEDVKEEPEDTVPFAHHTGVPASALMVKPAIYTQLEQFDAVIAVGPDASLSLVKELKKEIHNTKFLYVPASMYNNIADSDMSLGYDTAVNYIIDSILRIQDTIDSLKYPNPRLFGIQITGKSSAEMLHEAAFALDGYPIYSNWKGFDSSAFNAELKRVFDAGQTYYFVLFDSTVRPEDIPDHVQSSIQVDWKWGQIDASLCGGPYPSAQDRLLAMQLAHGTLEWVLRKKPSGKLMVQNRKALFEAF